MKKEKTEKIYKSLSELTKAQILWKLFYSTISISFVAFGGGFVMLPLLRKKYVETYKWIKDDEISDYIALAQASPGTIIGNSTMLIGFHAAGILGAFVTMIASILPPVAMITVIYYFYEAIRESIYVSYMMTGLQAGVAAVIFSLLIDMSSKIIKTKNILSILIMLISFAITFFLKFSVIYLILIAIVIGIASAFIREKRNKKGGLTENNVSENKEIKETFLNKAENKDSVINLNGIINKKGSENIDINPETLKEKEIPLNGSAEERGGNKDDIS